MFRHLTLALAFSIVLGTDGIGAQPQPGVAAEVQRIGKEALIELPESALWGDIGNFRPGDGEEVKHNPPRFCWSYTPNPADGGTDTAPKEFQFQVAYDKDFKNPAVDVRTASNAYNLLAPLKSSVCYWRVGYFNPANLKDQSTWTRKPGSWNAQPCAWSKTRTCRIATDAVAWDRSMLADEKYLAEKGKHPHILFTPGSRQALYEYLEAHGGEPWTSIKKQADKSIAQPWWSEAEPPKDLYVGVWSNALVHVAFVWQMTRDQRYLDARPQQVLVNMARYFIKNKGPITDGITVSAFAGMIRTLAFGYDWLYEVMTPQQRQEVLLALELRCKYVNFGGQCWGSAFYDPIDPRFSWGRGDPTGEYPGGFYVRAHAVPKQSHSHTSDNFHWSMMAALAAYPDSAAARELFDLGVNYMLGKTYFACDGGLGQGRGYTYVHVFEEKILCTHAVYGITFPEAQFQRNPFWNLFIDWYSRFLPVGFAAGHDAWADATYGPMGPWAWDSGGRNLAYFAGNGRALQHWQQQVDVMQHRAGVRGPDHLVVPFYFQRPAEPKDNLPLSKAFPSEGWAMGATFPSNTKECFRDGVGFTLQARPRGRGAGHSCWSDLSFELWAYGAALTDASAQDQSGYAYVPWSHYSLLINGVGPQQPRVQNEPFYNRIFAFREAPHYTYVAADGTRAYPHKGYKQGDERVESVSARDDVKKVQRHLLFVRKKYFVVYDALESDRLVTYTWLYHVPALYRIKESSALRFDMPLVDDPRATTNAVVQEDPLTLEARGAMLRFKYTASNVWSRVLPPRRSVPGAKAPELDVVAVPVHVVHVSRPQDLETIDLKEKAKIRSNPITGEDYHESCKHDSHYRAHALWISNKTPARKWHFMTVIYPQKPGSPPPEIKRLDDFTVEVVNGSEKDIVSFDCQTAHPATIVVDLPAMVPLRAEE